MESKTNSAVRHLYRLCDRIPIGVSDIIGLLKSQLLAYVDSVHPTGLSTKTQCGHGENRFDFSTNSTYLAHTPPYIVWPETEPHLLQTVWMKDQDCGRDLPVLDN